MNGKNYRLQILPLFEDDLAEIVDYISHKLKNPIAAENLVDAVEKAIYDRLPVAEAFEKFQSVRERKYPYYHIFVKNFIVYYVVYDNVMEVRRILYNRRNIKELI